MSLPPRSCISGATSQDILDTAAMLLAQRALEPLLDDAAGAADAAARLAARHRSTPMVGPHAAAAGAADLVRPARGRLDGRASTSGRAARPRCACTSWRCRWVGRWARVAPAIAARRGGASSGWPTRCCLAHDPRSRPASLAGALGGLGRGAREGRPRRHAARPDRRSARCARAGRSGARCVERDGAQAQPGRGACRCSPAPAACRGWSRRCWPAWSRSTSAPPAPGRPSGGPSPSCSGSSAPRPRGRRDLLEQLAGRPGADGREPPAARRGGGAGGAGPELDLGASSELIDRALLAHSR